MAVLIEALNLIIKEEAFRDKPSQREFFLQTLPSKAFCSDGVIFRIGFMAPEYAEKYIVYLEEKLDLTYLDDKKNPKDMVIVDMLKGPTTNCDWIGFKRERLFSHRREFKKSEEEFSIAWHLDNYGGIPKDFLLLNTEDKDIEEQFTEDGISFPYGWTPDNGIYSSDFLSNPEDDLEEISRDDKTISYKKRSTGELVYVAIPDTDREHSHLINKEKQSLKEEEQESDEVSPGLWNKFKGLFSKK